MAIRTIVSLARAVAPLLFAVPACSTASTSGLGGGGSAGSTGKTGCTVTPDCGGCKVCYETCVCAGTDPTLCAQSCATGAGGAGATAGTAGASGTAGTAASGGVAAMGGKSGAGATGAVGGTGGLGGSGATGGGSGICAATGIPPGITCAEIGTGNMVCDSCAQQSCCSQLEACFRDSECGGLQECVRDSCANAPDITPCIQQNCPQCVANPSTVALFNAIPDCIQAACAAECPAN